MPSFGISEAWAGILSGGSEAIFNRGWFKRHELQACSKPEYLGPGTLTRAEYAQCNGYFYLDKKKSKGLTNKRGW